MSRQRESEAGYRAGLLGIADEAGYGALQGVLIPADPPPWDEVLQAVQGRPELLRLLHRARAKRLSATRPGQRPYPRSDPRYRP
jgi:hypothetical protein